MKNKLILLNSSFTKCIYPQKNTYVLLIFISKNILILLKMEKDFFNEFRILTFLEQH